MLPLVENGHIYVAQPRCLKYPGKSSEHAFNGKVLAERISRWALSAHN